MRTKACARARAARFRLGRDVHHARRSRLIEMRQFTHFGSTRISSPRVYCGRSGSATRYAFARVSAGMSPDPCHSTGVISAPSPLRWAGRKRVRPARWRKSASSARRASERRIALPPSSSSGRARENFERHHGRGGLPGRPKKNFPRASPKTSGCPAESAPDRSGTPRPKIRHHLFHDVVLSRRNSTREQQQISLRPCRYFARVSRVSRATGRSCGTPPARATWAAREKCWNCGFKLRRFLVDIDNFVAGRQGRGQPDAGKTRGRAAECCQHGDTGVIQALPCPQHHLAPPMLRSPAG